MLEKVNLVLQVFRELRHRVVLPDVDSTLAPGRDVVKVAETDFE